LAKRLIHGGVAMSAVVRSVLTHFESLEDPRHTRNRLHLLGDVIVISVCGIIAGAEGPTGIARWAGHQEAWLKKFLKLPEGIPSRDCIRRVLSALKPSSFQGCFASWIASLTDLETGELRQIAIDGKTLRRSHAHGAELKALHLVSAWSTEQGLSLGQVATEEKSNEITAIPELLDQIDVSGALVSIDAMGCQKEIAKQIVSGDGDYVLAVKDNQPKLRAAIENSMAPHLEHERASANCRRHDTRDKRHGRLEDRSYIITRLPEDFPSGLKREWPHLKAIGCAMRIAENPDGTCTEDVRYYALSRYLSGPDFATATRQHWQIENCLHWVLDVNFREDESRIRNRVLANNVAWLRRFAIGLLKRHPKKDSLRGKRQSASWSTDFLTEVLTGVDT
jgi:predicted transposase YbfD/YdcC